MSFTANPVILVILWAIGISMIGLAGLIYLPMRVMAAGWYRDYCPAQSTRSCFGPALRAGGVDLGHSSSAKCFCFPWNQLRDRISGTAVDRGDGLWLLPRARSLNGMRIAGGRFLVRRGLALAAAFVVVRAINVYGDPLRWSHQASPVFTVFSFLNVIIFLPSLDFLLMTLGPAMVVMAWLENFRFHFANPLIVFGRVPFFYYGAHLLLAHLIAIGMNFVRYGAEPFLLIAPPSMGGPSKLFPVGYGFPLWTVYAVWVVVLLLLYPACVWFARLKQRRHDWWLTYL